MSSRERGFAIADSREEVAPAETLGAEAKGAADFLWGFCFDEGKLHLLPSGSPINVLYSSSNHLSTDLLDFSMLV